MVMEIRELAIQEIREAEYNPRHVLAASSPAYQKLKRGLQQFGLVEPLVWNETSATLVGGHARLAILRELGWQAVPVSVVRLDEAREKALNLLLNNLEAQGRYDPAKLVQVLESLDGLPEMKLTGFDDSMLRNLRFEPMPTEPSAGAEEIVEVMLRVRPEVFPELEPQLNELLERHEIEAHVRRIER
jgi:ParB-like chromosome segregation protein Spo0J